MDNLDYKKAKNKLILQIGIGMLIFVFGLIRFNNGTHEEFKFIYIALFGFVLAFYALIKLLQLIRFNKLKEKSIALAIDDIEKLQYIENELDSFDALILGNFKLPKYNYQKLLAPSSIETIESKRMVFQLKNGSYKCSKKPYGLMIKFKQSPTNNEAIQIIKAIYENILKINKDIKIWIIEK